MSLGRGGRSPLTHGKRRKDEKEILLVLQGVNHVGEERKEVGRGRDTAKDTLL